MMALALSNGPLGYAVLELRVGRTFLRFDPSLSEKLFHGVVDKFTTTIRPNYCYPIGGELTL